jgi:hypothetical protein
MRTVGYTLALQEVHDNSLGRLTVRCPLDEDSVTFPGMDAFHWPQLLHLTMPYMSSSNGLFAAQMARALGYNHTLQSLTISDHPGGPPGFTTHNPGRFVNSWNELLQSIARHPTLQLFVSLLAKQPLSPLFVSFLTLVRLTTCLTFVLNF